MSFYKKNDNIYKLLILYNYFSIFRSVETFGLKSNLMLSLLVCQMFELKSVAAVVFT